MSEQSRDRVAVLRSDLDVWFKALEHAAQEAVAGQDRSELAVLSGEVGYYRQQAALNVARVVATELRWFALRTQPIIQHYDGANRANVNRWNDARRMEVRAEQLDPGGPWPTSDTPPTAVPS